jgi:hypothetical protein
MTLLFNLAISKSAWSRIWHNHFKCSSRRACSSFLRRAADLLFLPVPFEQLSVSYDEHQEAWKKM